MLGRRGRCDFELRVASSFWSRKVTSFPRVDFLADSPPLFLTSPPQGRISTIQLHPAPPPTTTSSSSTNPTTSHPTPTFFRTTHIHPTSPSAFDLVIPIPLPNGQTLSFNALSDSPTKLDEILRGGEHGGVPLVSDEERGRIRGQIDRSVRMLGERLGKWKLGGS